MTAKRQSECNSTEAPDNRHPNLNRDQQSDNISLPHSWAWSLRVPPALRWFCGVQAGHPDACSSAPPGFQTWLGDLYPPSLRSPNMCQSMKERGCSVGEIEVYPWAQKEGCTTFPLVRYSSKRDFLVFGRADSGKKEGPMVARLLDKEQRNKNTEPTKRQPLRVATSL
jgi:hypothetical protein